MLSRHKSKNASLYNGFTLVELLGVIAIIALLANVVLMSIQGSLGASQEALIKRQVQTMNSGYQSFIASGGDMRKVFADEGKTSDDEAAGMGSRDKKKELAPIAVEVLMQPWDTKTFGVVGPFLPEDPTRDWFDSAGFISQDVLKVPQYIGFVSGSGFEYMGADPRATPRPAP